ncbi:MAG TPA: OmpA family protein, partial [Polyangiaceae bacterium]|nr:OmpA family protein [Polyangiaceae bacterium]
MSSHHPDSFIVRLAVDEFTVRVSRRPEPVANEQRGRAAQLLAGLRFELEAHDPRMLQLARHLVRATEGEAEPGLTSGSAPAGTEARELLERLELAFAQGRLVAEPRELPSLSDRRTPFLRELPPAAPPARESSTHSFELRLVDEVGQGIPRIDAEFSVDGVQVVPTNAAGVALLEGASSASATVSITDSEGLSAVLEPRWAKPRSGAAPKEANLQIVVFRGQKLGPFSLKAEVPNTVVLQPPLGQLFIELWDKSGRVVHANRKYEIDGPASFSGVTDEQGRLKHEQVRGGDYELTLFVEPNPDEPEFEPHQVKVPLVTLAPAEAAPQVRFVGAVPQATLTRMLGAFFNTNKTFLLPDGVASLADIEAVFRDNNPSQLLVVGHTDTTADAKINDPLSLERAKSLIAFLKDDVETWLKNYDSPPAGLQWGAAEDQAMLEAVDDFPDDMGPKERITRFQKDRSLSVDGVAGKQTRRQLIKEYMALDAATLSDPGFDIPLIAHGCGENFP